MEIDDEKDMIDFISGNPCKYKVKVNESICSHLNVGADFIGKEAETIMEKLQRKYSKQKKSDWYVANINGRMGDV